MWCYINRSDIETLFKHHPEISDYFESLTLFETKNACFLPRYIYHRFPSNVLQRYLGKNHNDSFEPIDIEFTGTLREEQKPIINKVLHIYNLHNFVHGIIKARPGIGKTVIAAYIVAKLGMKSLIVVDNSNLLNQWVKTFEQFTNIGIDNYDTFKQQLHYTSAPVTIGMIQTLTRRLKNDIRSTYDLVNQNNFGLVIYDEVHNTSAASEFAKGSLLFRTPNILGLSATPFQTGVSELLMKYTIGDIIYETHDYELTPQFKFVFYESELKKNRKYAINKTHDYITRKSMYNKFIVESENYLNLITSYTHDLLKENHRIMILCFTKKQVQTISERLQANNIDNTMFYGDAREITYNENVLVTTYAFAGKGFDYADLSAMILACPLAGKKSIIQTVGRILRTVENKNTPQVIDLVDMSFPQMFTQELKMKKNIIKNEFKCQVNEEHFGDY